MRTCEYGGDDKSLIASHKAMLALKAQSNAGIESAKQNTMHAYVKQQSKCLIS